MSIKNTLNRFVNKKVLWKNFVLRPMIILWVSGILFVIIISLIPHGSLSEINTVTGVDKIARIVVFSILSFIPAAFFSSIKFGLCMATSIAPFGFLLELAQKYFPARHFSPEDIIANNIGTIIGILAALVIRIIFHTGRRPS